MTFFLWGKFLCPLNKTLIFLKKKNAWYSDDFVEDFGCFFASWIWLAKMKLIQTDP